MTNQARLRWKTRVFAVIVILSNVFGNSFLTWGMKHRPEALTLSPVSYVQAILTPWVSLGVSLLILWSLARLALLSWADLSYVLPVTSLGYVGNAIAGKLFLSEQISAGRWAGTALIVAGTMLVGLGSPHASAEPASSAESATEPERDPA